MSHPKRAAGHAHKQAHTFGPQRHFLHSDTVLVRSNVGSGQ